MPVLRRRARSDNKVINGLFIHSSPPKVLQMNSASIKQLIHSGDVEKMEQAVLEGQGRKLVGEYSADYKTRTFLKSVPALMSKISLLHDAVNSDRLEELKALLDEEPERKKRLVMAKDETGVGLLHKAVYYDLKSIYRWLIDKFPHMVSMKDSEGRTAYHYSLMCKDSGAVQKLLVHAGADPSTLDHHQHSAKYYRENKDELELPSGDKSTGSSRKSTASRDGLNIKKSNIRIWIHQRNLKSLQQVVWEGHGAKLLVEHSNNARIKRFLEAVPHIMGMIQGIHCDVQNDDLDGLKNHVTPPIPPIVLSGKDINGLTPLHKAAGLDRQEIAEFIFSKYPDCINSRDNDGRTPLHYAALLKDDGKMTNFLIENGADESALDNKQKTAAYYRTRNSEMDAKLLQVVPECPRSAKESFAANFDWSSISASPSVNGLAKKVEKLLEDDDEEGSKEEEGSKAEEEGKKLREDGEHGEAEVPTRENGDKVQTDEKTNGNGIKEHDTKEEPVDEMNRDIKNIPNEDKAEDTNKNDDGAVKAEETDVPPLTEDNAGEREPFEENKIAAEASEAEENKDSNNNETEDDKISSEETMNENHQTMNEGEEAEGVKGVPSPSRTRPSSRAKSTRSSSQNDLKENSRPSSKISEPPTRSRPASAVSERSRPASAVSERGRPASRIKSTTRPSSRAAETAIEDGERVIEGVVHGNEAETMDNEGMNEKVSPESEEEIKALVEAGNMEQLAALVLNGEGEKLAGQTSENPELQAFLENVPLYMSKIRKIHEAARSGSLRDLQAALDRRKFAIAKDSISAKGASPLHVAVIFGNTSIVRYLAGRFPETVQVTNDDGRTPLHYAAVLKDNGHYYNLLIHLGADMRLEDKFGHSPEYYRKNQEGFSHRKLLKEFGAEENEAEEVLTDKDTSATENGQVDMPFFATEEGRYLASSLGDPLIKGLTEVANKRPEDPIAYLAQYLYNFANNRNNVRSRGRTQESVQQLVTGDPATVDDNNSVPASIDVVTIEPDESNEESAFSNTSRDEHGQSMLHFASSRSHGRNALFQLLLETDINVAYRDELYRTARDVSIQANLPDNTEEIDRYVLHIATKGDTDKLVELLLDGYDHITDIVDSDDVPIIEAVSKADQPETVSFLQSILAFEEKRERVHHAIRQGSINDVTTLLADENDTGSGKLLAIGKNSYGRCTMHIAVLCQQEEIIDYLANTFPDTLKLGDNLERTALHYAMGVEKMETISRVLIKAGSKRVTKDLKGRQPTYYFLNKSDIQRLQEEEETF